MISKSAFLFPNEADNCSCVKPSANADCLVIAIDAKIDKKIIVAIITAVVTTSEDENLSAWKAHTHILFHFLL